MTDELAVVSVNNLNDLFDELSPNQKKLYESTPISEAWSVKDIVKELSRNFLVKMTESLAGKELLIMVKSGLIQCHKSNSYKRSPVKIQHGAKNENPIIGYSGIDADKPGDILGKDIDISLKPLFISIARIDKYADKLRILMLEAENISNELEDHVIQIQKRLVEIKGAQIDPDQLKKFEHFKALMDMK